MWKPLKSAEGRAPSSLEKSLDKLARRLGTPPTKTLLAVFSGWDEAVGKEIAKHAKPQSLVNGVLNVRVDDPRWTTQLKWLGPSIAKKLNAVSGSKEIERLEVRYYPPASPD